MDLRWSIRQPVFHSQILPRSNTPPSANLPDRFSMSAIKTSRRPLRYNDMATAVGVRAKARRRRFYIRGGHSRLDLSRIADRAVGRRLDVYESCWFIPAADKDYTRPTVSCR